MGGGDCGYDFKVGQSYLVYAHREKDSQTLVATICSRTRPLDEASEDLAYIRSLPSAPPGATIHGPVQGFRRTLEAGGVERLGPLSGVRIELASDGVRQETQTDAFGEYRFEHLPPGKYSVQMLAPEGLAPARTEQQVEVFDKGCALVGFSLQPDTSLSGALVDEYGEPAAKIKVDLVLASEVDAEYQRNALFAYTDEAGDFRFAFIPPGEYLLGVRLSRINEPQFPYPRMFYPGVSNLDQARKIQIAEGEVLTGYHLRLPHTLAQRKIEGEVLWPDGTPAPEAWISLTEVEYADRSLAYGGDAKVDQHGHFSVTAYEGLRYAIKAVINIPNGQRHAEPVQVPGNGHVTGIRLILSEPSGNCSKCIKWKKVP